MPDIIHVDMDCFFAAVEVKDNPDLAGKPVIVGALPGTRGVVAACSYEARKFGVHSAMPVSQAFKKCPHGVFLRPNGKRYMEESEHIMAIFHDFTPLVEPLSLDEAFLDVSGLHRLFGDSMAIGRAIKSRISQETGLVASVGVAPTKFIAKIASDLGKPDGFVVVNDDEVHEFLWPLSARKIWGVGPATWKKLEKLNLKTIGDIAEFPVETLERVFGKSGRHLHDLALGIDLRRVNPVSDRKQVSNEHTFDRDTSDMDEVERVLLSLSDRVADRLHRKGRLGRTVTLKLRDETFRTVTRSATLGKTISAGRDIYREALTLFRAEDLGSRKVRLVGVGVSGFQDEEQTSLFGEETARTAKVEDVLANIRDRFGRDAITRASLVRAKKSSQKAGATPDDRHRYDPES